MKDNKDNKHNKHNTLRLNREERQAAAIHLRSICTKDNKVIPITTKPSRHVDKLIATTRIQWTAAAISAIQHHRLYHVLPAEREWEQREWEQREWEQRWNTNRSSHHERARGKCENGHPRVSPA